MGSQIRALSRKSLLVAGLIALGIGLAVGLTTGPIEWTIINDSSCGLPGPDGECLFPAGETTVIRGFNLAGAIVAAVVASALLTAGLSTLGWFRRHRGQYGV